MQPSGNLVADTICRTADIGLTITGAADAGTFTIIDAAPVAVEGHCPDCTQPGKLRDHTVRRLVDLPVVGFPTRLHVRVPRLTCTNQQCRRKIFQASLNCANDGAKLTHRVTGWILQRLAIDRMSVAATAKALGVGWGGNWSIRSLWTPADSSSTTTPPIWTGCASSGWMSTCGSTPESQASRRTW